ncbi:hypothetical protein HYV86_03190 [Candidatus Woesearchaeota archaeon]|nr:hypothetical protein [Candidatus Woesearchaeota archaeon]
MDLITLPHLLPQLESVLRGYQTYHENKIQFGQVSPFTPTPEKPNTARTTIQVRYNGTQHAELVAIIFAPGDGTGDTGLYQERSIEVPEQYQHEDKPQRVFPRSKNGVIEGYFPLFAIRDDGLTIPYAGSLEELTARNGTIVKAWDVGQKPEVFTRNVNGSHSSSPNVSYTCGFAQDGTYFGDPHAMYNATTIHQVAGFLTIKKADSPLLEIVNKWKISS